MEKTKSIFFNNKQLLPPSFTKFVGSIFFFSLKKDLHLLSHGLSLLFFNNPDGANLQRDKRSGSHDSL